MNGYAMKALEDIIVPDNTESVILGYKGYEMEKWADGKVIWRVSITGEQCSNPPYHINQTTHCR
jgi:hypothetical protein